MLLTRVTITGADDGVDPRALVDLSHEFPFVEWGILRSVTREGTSRYPTDEWREKLESFGCTHAMSLSAHFCGQLVRDTLDGDQKWFTSLPSEYDRVQLNGFYATREVETFVGSMGVEWILQCKSEREAFDAAALANALPGNRISALWDCSGGRGVRPPHWLVAPPGLRLGYAGGITPENVVDTVSKISLLSDQDFWIDIESGVRTDDRFDLEKVRAVLEKTLPLIK